MNDLVNKSGDLVNDLVNDCISRQATQDFISTMNACNDISDEAYQELIVYFENLPPAQPEHLHIVMEKLNKQYEKAINNPFVIKPMAWALYQVWKEYDR